MFYLLSKLPAAGVGTPVPGPTVPVTVARPA